MTKGNVMLNLGAGKTRIPGFVTVDARPLPGIDIVAPADKLDMFVDNSVDLIYSSHMLECYGRHDTLRVLREWYRVLRPGGTLRLAVPDFEAVVGIYRGSRNLGIVLGHLVGRQDCPENTHLMVFDFIYLTTLLGQAGFRNIRRYDWRQGIHKDYDDYSQSYYPHMDKEHGVQMSLNIEADK